MKKIKHNPKNRSMTLLIKGFVLAVAVLIAAVVWGLLHYSGSHSTPSMTLILVPANSSRQTNQRFKLSIWENSGSQQVNAVQANLSYDPRILSFSNVDTAVSDFNVPAQAEGGNGKIKISMGKISPLSGRQKVADVYLDSLVKSGTISVNFSSGTALVNSTNHLNILKNIYSGSYELKD